jgi:zinc transporter
MNDSSAETATGKPEAGIIYVYRFRDDGSAVSMPCEQVNEAVSEHGGWTWVHIGLADARARTWIEREAPLSDVAREALAGADEHIRLEILGSEIIGVMPDLHQMFSGPSDDIVRLRFVMTERMLITSRRTPVHSLELTRRSIDAGRRFITPFAFLDGIVDQFADAMCALSDTIGDQLDIAESHLLKEELGRERMHLGPVRLQLAHMHRQLMQLNLLFQRIEPRIAVENPEAAQYERARLLLDEVASKMAALTNRRLFTLSILTACLLPPTLVTGFFGMNTKDLPFQNTDGGTWYAFVIAAAAGGAAYWLLQRLRAF